MTSGGGLFFRQLLKGFLGCEWNPFCQADVRKHRNAGAEAAQSMIKATGAMLLGEQLATVFFAESEFLCPLKMR